MDSAQRPDFGPTLATPDVPCQNGTEPVYGGGLLRASPLTPGLPGASLPEPSSHRLGGCVMDRITEAVSGCLDRSGERAVFDLEQGIRLRKRRVRRRPQRGHDLSCGLDHQDLYGECDIQAGGGGRLKVDDLLVGHITEFAAVQTTRGTVEDVTAQTAALPSLRTGRGNRRLLGDGRVPDDRRVYRGAADGEDRHRARLGFQVLEPGVHPSWGGGREGGGASLR